MNKHCRCLAPKIKHTYNNLLNKNTTVFLKSILIEMATQSINFTKSFVIKTNLNSKQTQMYYQKTACSTCESCTFKQLRRLITLSPVLDSARSLTLSLICCSHAVSMFCPSLMMRRNVSPQWISAEKKKTQHHFYVALDKE